jgi:hypothetical protein
MLKPGTGCKDAPRAWSICLTDATNAKFGARPSLHDHQLIMRHDKHGELEFLATKHVDDIKVAAPPHVLEEFITTLYAVFGQGELDITRESFTNCGVRHLKTPTGYTLDQTEYLNALKPLIIPNASQLTSDLPAPPELAASFLSLLMALAYTLLTRIDLSVYVIALQRVAQAPTMIHLRRLNAIVRFAQSHEVKLTYDSMHCQSVLEIHSDAGFRKEEKDGIPVGKAMRGANFLRLGERRHDYTVCHVLDWSCCQLKTVTRSTFASELAACIAATDSGISLAITLHEIQRGPLTARRALEIREHGDELAVSIDMRIDAMSIISAISAEHVKPPAEKSLLCHLLWLKEIIVNKLMRSLSWVDTRDMTGDGHTKGSISRTALWQLAAGQLYKTHPHKPAAIKVLPGSFMGSCWSFFARTRVWHQVRRSRPVLENQVWQSCLPGSLRRQVRAQICSQF